MAGFSAVFEIKSINVNNGLHFAWRKNGFGGFFVSEMFDRSKVMLGADAMEKLARAHVMVVGCGGVGGYAIEALARTGVGRITVVDFDEVSESNINRQIIADTQSVGKKKAELFCERVKLINPDAQAVPCIEFVTKDNARPIIKKYSPDFVIDAIDTVSAKIAIISACKAEGVEVISSMGTGNKLDPMRLKITDISKTNTCPLARAVRLGLKAAEIQGVSVLWSDEKPLSLCVDSQNGRHAPASLIFVPAAAGLLIARHAVLRIIK